MNQEQLNATLKRDGFGAFGKDTFRECGSGSPCDDHAAHPYTLDAWPASQYNKPTNVYLCPCCYSEQFNGPSDIDRAMP